MSYSISCQAFVRWHLLFVLAMHFHLLVFFDELTHMTTNPHPLNVPTHPLKLTYTYQPTSTNPHLPTLTHTLHLPTPTHTHTHAYLPMLNRI